MAMTVKIMSAITMVVLTAQLYYNIINLPSAFSGSLSICKMKIMITINILAIIAILTTVILSLATK